MQRAATVLAELVNVIDMSKNVTSMPMLIYSILFNATKLQKNSIFRVFYGGNRPFLRRKKNIGIRLRARSYSSSHLMPTAINIIIITSEHRFRALRSGAR